MIFNCLKVAISFVPTLIYAILANRFSGEGGMGIAVDPFYIYEYWKTSFVLTFVCSFAFPIAVLVLLNKKNIKNYFIMLCFGWGSAILSLTELSVLKEAGAHATHGNFGWGYAISVFILFIGSIIIYIKEAQNNVVVPRIRLNIATVILVLHFLFGVYYFYLCWSGNFYNSSFLPKGAL